MFGIGGGIAAAGGGAVDSVDGRTGVVTLTDLYTAIANTKNLLNVSDSFKWGVQSQFKFYSNADGEGQNIILKLDESILTLTDIVALGGVLNFGANQDDEFFGIWTDGLLGLKGTSGIAFFSDMTTAKDYEVTDATKGIILRDTQGTPHKWRVTIDNTGSLVTSDLGVA